MLPALASSSLYWQRTVAVVVDLSRLRVSEFECSPRFVHAQTRAFDHAVRVPDPDYYRKAQVGAELSPFRPRNPQHARGHKTLFELGKALLHLGLCLCEQMQVVELAVAPG